MNREDVLSRLPLKTGTVDVPEWGGQVKVRELNAAERFTFADRMSGDANGEKLAHAMVDVVLAACQNEVGPLFQPADRDALFNSDGKVLQRIAEAVLALSGLTEQSVEQAKKK